MDTPKREATTEVIKHKMGQAFTAGSIAAVIVVVVVAVIVIIYVYTYPAKKATFNVDQSTLNPRIKNGASARIMSLATGRYLRRRPGATWCTDATLEPNHTLVTADARRVDATLWKLGSCTSCPPSKIPYETSPSSLDFSVEGRWCFYTAESDTSSHFLTFTRYTDDTVVPVFNGARTELLNHSEPFTRGTIDENGMVVTPAENYLRSDFWFDLRSPADYKGPNGAVHIVTGAYVKDGAEHQLYLSSVGANGVYYKASYDPNNPPPVSTGWSEVTCYEPKAYNYGPVFSSTYVNVHSYGAYFVELV